MLNWNALAPHTEFLVHRLHYLSLAFMVAAYAIKIRGLYKKPVAKEGTPPRGDHGEGIRYSYLLIGLPWEVESMRRHWVRWLEFAIFHVCMAIAIGVAFVMPWAHQWMTTPALVYALQAIFATATLIGISRLARRIMSPVVRAISTPDDYFCILLLTLWAASGVMMVPQQSELWLLIYFGLATFFLFYVPFSKISHYVYWFFVRYYVGKHFGHRGVFPTKQVQKA